MAENYSLRYCSYHCNVASSTPHVGKLTLGNIKHLSIDIDIEENFSEKSLKQPKKTGTHKGVFKGNLSCAMWIYPYIQICVHAYRHLDMRGPGITARWATFDDNFL